MIQRNHFYVEISFHHFSKTLNRQFAGTTGPYFKIRIGHNYIKQGLDYEPCEVDDHSDMKKDQPNQFDAVGEP